MPVTSEPLLIVGLGNPGSKYALHRHNVGFMALDEIAAFYDVTDFTTKATSSFAEARIDGNRVYFLKPMTYMNKSGQPVRHYMDYYNLPLENILVIHDELDLAFGRIKLKCGGGSAGHNGIKDITSHCGGDFWRLRFGVGHPGEASEVSNYVLSNFSKPEMKSVGEILDGVAQRVSHWIAGDVDKFSQEIA